MAVPGQAAVAQRSEPLTTAVVRLRIDSRPYNNRLGQDVTQLVGLVEDELRAMFAKRFPFVQWRAPDARDTVFVFLRDGDDRNLYLDVLVRGPTGGSERMLHVQFETRADAINRRDWTMATLARYWTKHTNEVLDREAKGLVEVVGNMPLPANVKLYKDRLQADVALGPAHLKASLRSPPKFRLQGTLEEPSARTQGPAELMLAGCQPTTPRNEYLCDIETILYKERRESAVTQRELLQRSNLRQLTLHLLEYSSRANAGPIVLTSSAGNR